MKQSLGQVLKGARELMSLTLRQVEEAAGVSNAYLSQLENGKIKKPSANVLYKLSTLYKIEMDVLLHACGLIKDEPTVKSKMLVKLGCLTVEEEKELISYLKYLRHKRR